MPSRHNALRYRSCATEHGPEPGQLATTGGILPGGDHEGTLLRGGCTTIYQEAAMGEVLETVRLQEEASSSVPYPWPPIGVSCGRSTVLE